MILKVLLVLFLVYFLVFRFFGYLLKPLFSMMSNSQQKERYSDPFSQRQNSSREGEIKIERVPGKNKKNNENFDGGEYVDYEEVD